MLYPPKFWVSVRPSVCLSVRPSVRPSVSAHHHSCIGNSSYSFRPILLKLYRCFKDGLKICILFFQNPEIIFYHFFPIFNLDIFRALILQICIWSMYLVSAKINITEGSKTLLCLMWLNYNFFSQENIHYCIGSDKPVWTFLLVSNYV